MWLISGFWCYEADTFVQRVTALYPRRLNPKLYSCGNLKSHIIFMSFENEVINMLCNVNSLHEGCKEIEILIKQSSNYCLPEVPMSTTQLSNTKIIWYKYHFDHLPHNQIFWGLGWWSCYKYLLCQIYEVGMELLLSVLIYEVGMKLLLSVLMYEVGVELLLSVLISKFSSCNLLIISW
jgi:hypothetical protein